MGCKIPIRLWIGLMVFYTTYINYATRSNLSISITAMVKSKVKKAAFCLNQTGNASMSAKKSDANYGPRFDWDENAQGQVLGAYFIGYIITSAPGGFIAEWIGPVWTILITTFITGIFNEVGIYVARFHWGALFGCRFVMGLMSGPVYPALQCLIARWAPPKEKGKFVSALMGNTLGTCVTWSIVGIITKIWGWDWGFRVLTIQVVVFLVIFWIICADSPEKHRWISEDELNYIKESQEGKVSKSKAVPPYLKIFGSGPFWALVALHFANLWGLNLQITGIPKFLVQVIGINIKEAGFLSSLPSLVRLFLGLMFGFVGDLLKKNEKISPAFTRKFFTLFSHIIPGLCIAALALVKCNGAAAIALLTVSMSINGAVVLTNLQNPQDLAPNFAGSIFGIISLLGGVTGFIVPALTGFFATFEGIKGWMITFILGGAVYCAGALLFIIFGKTNVQPWNEKKDEA